VATLNYLSSKALDYLDELFVNDEISSAPTVSVQADL